MSTSAELVATGLLMGLVYVSTGPDHLAGMAAIVIGAPSKQADVTYEEHHDQMRGRSNSAFLLGLRWGLGNSVALVVAGSSLAVFSGAFSSDYVVMDDRLGLILQGLVGIYTMALGMRGVRRSFDNRSGGCVLPIDEDDGTAQFNNASAEGDEGEGIVVEIPMPSHSGRPEGEDMLLSSMRDALVHDSLHGSSSHADLSMVSGADDIEQRIFNAADSLRRNAGGESMTSLTQFGEGKSAHSLKSSASTKCHANGPIKVQSNRRKGRPRKASSFVGKNSGKNSVLAPVGCAHTSRDRCRTCATSDALLAVMAGLLHGASGAGSVLGVVPASEIFDPAKAAAYLGAFCVTSSLVMGGFAALCSGFGKWLAGRPDSRRYGSRVFLVEAGSGLVSLIVGAIWLIMISAGRLDDIQ